MREDCTITRQSASCSEQFVRVELILMRFEGHRNKPGKTIENTLSAVTVAQYYSSTTIEYFQYKSSIQPE